MRYLFPELRGMRFFEFLEVAGGVFWFCMQNQNTPPRRPSHSGIHKVTQTGSLIRI